MSDVVITPERLRELETAAAEVVILREKLNKRNPKNIEKLRAYDAAHPERAAERSKLSKQRHREEYNAKQRERRRLAKEQKAANLPGGEASVAVVASDNFLRGK